MEQKNQQPQQNEANRQGNLTPKNPLVRNKWLYIIGGIAILGVFVGSIIFLFGSSITRQQDRAQKRAVTDNYQKISAKYQTFETGSELERIVLSSDRRLEGWAGKVICVRMCR